MTQVLERNDQAPEVVEARYPIEQGQPLDVALVLDPLNNIVTYPNGEAAIIKTIQEALGSLRPDAAKVFLAAEGFDPLRARRMSDLNERPITEFLEGLESDVYFVGRRYVVSSSGRNHLLVKYGQHFAGEGDLAFRVCAAMTNHPLTDAGFYFVPARAMGSCPTPEPHQTSFINDDMRGHRVVRGAATHKNERVKTHHIPIDMYRR